MALINDFKIAELQSKSVSIGSSGAQKESWNTIDKIKVALYDVDQLTIYQSLKTDQYDYAGFSFYIGFEHKRGMQRLVIDGEIYSIEKPVRPGLVTYFLLKKVRISERQ